MSVFASDVKPSSVLLGPGRPELSIYHGWSVGKRLRRRVLSSLYRLPDSGLFGLTPLQTHVLICGFPASGTTLLQLMVENGLPQARRFGREVGGWRAATYTWRNHAIVVSKVPHDLFRLEPLRAFYAARQTRLRVLLTLRDPRDLLTAKRPRTGHGRAGCGRGRHGSPTADAYCISPEQWHRYWIAFGQNRTRTDACVIRYEDMVTDVAATQGRVEQFVGHTMSVSFDQCMAVDRPDFDVTTLCGRRPVDATGIARWRHPDHVDRLRSALLAVPKLATAVVQLGYESDEGWADRYR